MLLRNEIVNKLRSFVDFRVLLNYNFGLCTFLISRPMGGIKRRWENPLKTVEFLGSTDERHHVGPGQEERERQGQVYFTRSLSVQRIQPRPSIQPIIKFIFSQHYVGLKTQAMRQNEMPFCISNFKTKQ